jgi:polyketide cyclase/dehydrase/lipid transport protein
MIQIILILALALGALLTVIALQPSAFRIARSATISAPAPAVFAQINDFRNWQNWSPWEEIDSSLKRTYEGPTSGTGAAYTWAGDRQVGEGRMTIIESRPAEFIRIRLEFIKPFAATHTAEFLLKPEGNNTTVTWSMSGNKNFVAKGFSLLMNMDKMIGGQFETGLRKLERAAGPSSPA